MNEIDEDIGPMKCLNCWIDDNEEEEEEQTEESRGIQLIDENASSHR